MTRELCTCGSCTRCRERKRKADWRARNPEKVRAYAQANAESLKRHRADFKERHPERGAESSRKYREAHPERHKETRRNYYEANREEITAERRQRGRDNPEKEKARGIVGRAVRAGRLIRGECEIGEGCWGRIEAHHDDYAKPLEVRWLCQRHHEALRTR